MCVFKTREPKTAIFRVWLEHYSKRTSLMVPIAPWLATRKTREERVWYADSFDWIRRVDSDIWGLRRLFSMDDVVLPRFPSSKAQDLPWVEQSAKMFSRDNFILDSGVGFRTREPFTRSFILWVHYFSKRVSMVVPLASLLATRKVRERRRMVADVIDLEYWTPFDVCGMRDLFEMDVLWAFSIRSSRETIIVSGYTEKEMEIMTNEPWTREMCLAVVLDRPWEKRHSRLLESAIRNSRSRRRAAVSNWQDIEEDGLDLETLFG